MKLSAETLEILKNYAKINPNFFMEAGNTVKACASTRSIWSKATIAENFDLPFIIYDMPELLNVIAAFKSPSIEFAENYMDIIDDEDASFRTRYWYADIRLFENTFFAGGTIPNLVMKADENDPKFIMSAVQYSRILKAVGLINCKDVKFVGDDEKIRAVVYDKEGSNPNTFTVDLQDTNPFGEFEYCVTSERLLMIPGSYECTIIKNRAIRAINTEKPIEYVVSLDAA